MQIILNSLANIIQILYLNKIIMLDVLIGSGKKTKMPVGIKLNFFSIVLFFLLPGCDGSSSSRSYSSSDTTFTKSKDINDNLDKKKEVLEHLKAMANNIDSPGTHPNPDIEKIYEKIDKGQGEAANISDFDSSDKSIFWLLLRILSFLCANVDDGQDQYKPYKECTRKYLLETIEEGSLANNLRKDAFGRLIMA